MPEKLVVLAQGSPRDPAYCEQNVLEWIDEDEIDDIDENEIETPFFEYLHEAGIKTLEKDLVVSCHGNTELTLNIARDIQKLADEGHKIVVIAQGGLYFALPSIIAANAPTVPVISVPLDGGPTSYDGLDAFLAPQVPSGTAVIGGAGIARYDVAARATKEILTKEFKGVCLFNPTERLQKKLTELKVPVLGETTISTKYGLILSCLDAVSSPYITEIDEVGDLGIFTLLIDYDKYPMPDANNLKTDCTDCSIEKSLYVRGEDNLAFFAAKIVSQYNETARNALREAAAKKAASYEKRSITLDSFT